MDSWQIILTDSLDEAGVTILEKESRVVGKKGITADDLKKEIKNYDAVIVRSRTKVTRELIAVAPNLKVIGRCGVGVDNIDIEAAAERGIIVVNAPCATTTSVAELTVGMIFCLAREIPRADAGLKHGG